jgi:uncharacterized cupin superfamily protein
MEGLILAATMADVEMERSSIPTEWLLSGRSETRFKLLGKTRDRLGFAMLWECGAVSYKWYYANDEAYIVLSGEGFMTDEKGKEHRFGAGDVAFFPAGTRATWRHPHHFRKVAVLKDAIWPPFALGLKAWNKFLQMVGIRGKAPF